VPVLIQVIPQDFNNAHRLWFQLFTSRPYGRFDPLLSVRASLAGVVDGQRIKRV